MPDFEVVDQDGNAVSSKDLIGKKTIIYFYPKDNTSGCTAEACSLRDNYESLQAKGYNVVGVSKDSAASHKKFADKYELPFTLLADTSTEMIQAFGAWGEKSLYGRKYMGTLRQTFIFDEDGTLVEIIEKVDELSKELTEHISQSEERSALEARRRILRFNDELLNHVMHSKEYFDEILSDIDIYERYCREHPNFPNNKTVMSIEHIKECYKKCEKEDSFL